MGVCAVAIVGAASSAAASMDEAIMVRMEFPHIWNGPVGATNDRFDRSWGTRSFAIAIRRWLRGREADGAALNDSRRSRADGAAPITSTEVFEPK
jgi:hypothetical protein